MEVHNMKPRQAYPGTQAVARAVGLLKAFSPETPELRLQELCASVGLNKTTAYRLLKALEGEGMVERAPDGDAWRLGPEIVALGSRALGGVDLRAAAREEIRALAAETRETVTLEVLAGAETLILDEAMGGHVIGTMPSVGTRWPAHATSTGKALLAELSEDARAALLPKHLARPTPRTIGDRGVLERELQRVLARGWATSMEELEPGFAAVGAVVRSAAGQPLGAISVGGPRSRIGARMEALGRRVSAAAARLSARLGHREEDGRGIKAPLLTGKVRT
jgi:IclR family acetate operon transcriptional repressor